MVKCRVPKKVTLPNGRTFYARYKRQNQNFFATKCSYEKKI